MNFKSFKELVKEIKIGKHLPDAVYLHKSCMEFLPQTLLAYLGKIYSTEVKNKPFNLLKVFKKEFRVSFLEYNSFETDPHPRLNYSVTVNLENAQVKILDYSKSENPPILHRKETFLDPNDSLYQKCSALTQQEESFGLFKNVNKIGFKKYWDNLIAKNNLVYIDHEIKEVSAPKIDINFQEIQKVDVDVERHKTAISRNNLSRPLQTLLGYNLIDKDTTYFDYGCGLGDDLKELQAHGFKAEGWDPVFKKVTSLTKSEIVNLGFVINVIEDINERKQVLKKSFSLATRLLVVSAMTKNGVDEKNGKIYRDGILTSRNTFQKYYAQEELKEFIEKTLGTDAIPVAMGIFYVYKNDTDYAEHLNRQYHSNFKWNLKALNNKDQNTKTKKQRKTYFEKHRSLLNEFYLFILNLGRKPKPNEFIKEEEIKSSIGSLNKAFNLLMEEFGHEEFAQATNRRKEELLTFSALMHFRKRVVFKDLGKTLQNDIKEYFGQITTLEAESKELLFKLGQSELIAKLCNDCHHLGYLDDQALYILYDQLQNLPLLLRLYILCATQYYGEINEIDIIKIHKATGKATMLVYDDLENNDLPELKLRVKVSLRGQKIDVFNYSIWPDKQLLYYKSKYLPSTDERFEKWAKINTQLERLKIPINGYGPSKDAYESQIKSKL